MRHYLNCDGGPCKRMCAKDSVAHAYWEGVYVVGGRTCMRGRKHPAAFGKRAVEDDEAARWWRVVRMRTLT